ncbi:MAG: SUF system NifU family Fe-S cluster assembly protein [Firmicutes bacterium]|nr:SUF system NifU family Fe-S cluster assembly protein [Bacillota bacterium]
MESELKREIILEHFQNPLNKENVNDDNYKLVNTRNPNCIDNLDIYILFKEDLIKDIKFTGEACAISTASTSIMIKNLIGKSLKDAKLYITNFYHMCDELEYNEELLNEALAFSDIYKQNNRKNCALLPYKGVLKALEEYEEK